MLSFNTQKIRKAIAYYRHSAEDKQENSVPIQREHAQKFASQYQIEIIHEEADEGKSGLSSNRPGFEKLFRDWVLNKEAPEFEYVLVYDVSRWGRFQDQNEGGYFEFLCKQHGKKVIYISRGFPKEEQQLFSHLQTSIERYMAAEYSRQLSDKVFYGCKKVSEQGYSAGGTACYGMVRLLLDVNKKAIRVLKKGEHKQIANERVTFIPLGDKTTEAVKEMFTMLVERYYDISQIADELNEQNIPSANGGKWDRSKVLKVLTNETYIGSRIYNKTWHRLKQQARHNPRSEWVISPNAFPAIVSAQTFSQAQEHLYWLLPSKWKRGIRTINSTYQFFRKEVEQILKQQGIEEDNFHKYLQKIPVIFAVNFYHDSTAHWCFVLPEGLGGYDYVLGVTILLDQKDPIDKFFLIPTEDFTSTNFIIFSEKDNRFSNYQIQKNEIETKLLSLLKIKELIPTS